MRKEREREKLRELEELQLTNPELAAERIASEEAVRIGERASLKHRNSSKYLQQQAQRARKNNDKEVFFFFINFLPVFFSLWICARKNPVRKFFINICLFF